MVVDLFKLPLAAASLLHPCCRLLTGNGRLPCSGRFGAPAPRGQPPFPATLSTRPQRERGMMVVGRLVEVACCLTYTYTPVASLLRLPAPARARPVLPGTVWNGQQRGSQRRLAREIQFCGSTLFPLLRPGVQRWCALAAPPMVGSSCPSPTWRHLPTPLAPPHAPACPHPCAPVPPCVPAPSPRVRAPAPPFPRAPYI
jgi:hypothetical protein